MNLSELIFKRLSADENLQTMLATYAGAPAIFDSEFPATSRKDGKEPRSIRGYATVSICRSIRNDHRREPCMLQCIRIKPVQ